MPASTSNRSLNANLDGKYNEEFNTIKSIDYNDDAELNHNNSMINSASLLKENINVKLPPVPPFPVIKSKNSLIAKYLSTEVWTKLSTIKTKTAAFTLEKAIACAIKLDDQQFGFYCGDKDSYEEFKEIFDPIIKKYHNLGPTISHTSDTDINKINISFDIKAPIRSVRVRVGRSIDGFGLPAGILREKRNEIESLMKKVFQSLHNDLSGTYHSLSDLEEEVREQLIENHYLFVGSDRVMDAAGIMRDWPEGRGIFYNKSKTLIVWVNEEDHLRIISMQKGNDLKSTFKRLYCGVNSIQQSMEKLHGTGFILHPQYGYLHSCPTNLGTGMRASVHIDLPGWAMEGDDALKDRCRNLSLQCRGAGGESRENIGYTYDISNRYRLGYTEVDLVHTLIEGVNILFKEDTKLQVKYGL